MDLMNRLLEDLDPELIVELEERIRAKQVERLPISKGEVLLHGLSLRNPYLEEDILEEHEARQFYYPLAGSLTSSSAVDGMNVPSTPVHGKRPPSRPSTGKAKRVSVDSSATNSPVLQPVKSDLTFDMDGDGEALSASPSAAKLARIAEVVVIENPWRDANGKPLKEQSSSANQKLRPDPDGPDGWSEVRKMSKGYALDIDVIG
jgi:hypothetical protein